MIAVMTCEWRMVSSDTGRSVSSMRLWLLVSSRILIEQSPIIVSRTSASGAQVFWSIDTGIRGRRRRQMRCWIRTGRPRPLLVWSHETRLRALSRCGFWITAVGLRIWATSLHGGIDGGERGETLEGGRTLEVLLIEPVLPTLPPGIVVFTLVKVDIQLPVDLSQPLVFELIQFRHTDTTDLGPRTILECVVVQEFTSKKKTNGQHSPNFAVTRLESGIKIQLVHPSCQVIHSKKDCRSWKSC